MPAYRPFPVILLGAAVALAGACNRGDPQTDTDSEAGPDAVAATARPLVLNDPDRTASPIAAIPNAPADILLTDIDGNDHGTLSAAGTGDPAVFYFVRTDCPISNQYAPEIRRICADYGAQGTRCFLVYIDPAATADDIRQHIADYGHTLPAIADPGHALVTVAGATITPEVAVFSEGEVAYRGRIDNLYEDLGRPRRVVTEHELRDALDDLSANRPVATPRTQATGCFIE